MPCCCACNTMAAMSLSSSNANAREMMWKFWYPALRTEQVRRNKLVRAMLLDVPLVLGRDTTGKPFALRDVCPHRAFPLSFGQFDGANVECAYHGWKFNAHTGQCNAIPSWTEGSKLKCERIYAGSFPCEERDGYVWAYMTNPEGRGLDELPPPVPELPKFGGKFETAQLHAELPCGVDQAIIGLMDPAHGPFVHQAWWWRSRHSIHEKEKHFEPIPQGFRMSAHTPSANSAPYKLLGVYGQPIETTIDFVLPNRRYETLRCGDKWFASLTTVTPTTPGNSRIDVYGAWNVFYGVPFVTAVARFFGERFVRQDQITMVQQAEGLKYNPALMLIDDADRPAKWYFALKRARLEADESGRAMQHPMDGPVTLRWRS